MSDWTHAQYNSDAPDAIVEKIRRSYRSSLKLPWEKGSKQFFLCPVGLVGAGKSTVTKPLAEMLGMARVSTDEVREMLKARGHNYDRARDVILSMVEELAESGYSIAIDANCGSIEIRHQILDLSRKYNITPIWIRIAPPESFIINKLKNYPHTWLFKDADEAVASYFQYKKKYGDFSDLDMPYVYTFDTSRADIDGQIEEAAEFIRKKMKV